MLKKYFSINFFVDLIEYTIHFRQKTPQGYRYRIKDETIPSSEPTEVILDGTTGAQDPLQDLMTVEMRILECTITEVVIKDNAYVKRY